MTAAAHAQLTALSLAAIAYRSPHEALAAYAPQMRSQLEGLLDLLEGMPEQTPAIRRWREEIDTTLRATA